MERAAALSRTFGSTSGCCCCSLQPVAASPSSFSIVSHFSLTIAALIAQLVSFSSYRSLCSLLLIVSHCIMSSTKPVSTLTAAPPSNTAAPPAPAAASTSAPASSAPSTNESKEPLREVKSEVTADGMRIESNWDEVVASFDDMNLKDDLLRGIYAYGFEKPSAIQQRGIMPILADHGHHRAGAERDGQDGHLLHLRPAADRPQAQEDTGAHPRGQSQHCL